MLAEADIEWRHRPYEAMGEYGWEPVERVRGQLEDPQAARRGPAGTTRVRSFPVEAAVEQSSHRLLSLQRRIGNRAVVDTLGSETVQRYHLIGPKDIKPGRWEGLAAANWRVSDDEQMVVRDSDMSAIQGGAPLQAFYAETGIIDDAAGKLAKMGSPFQLSAGNSQVRGPAAAEGGERPTLQEVVFAHADRAQQAAKTTFRNCDENTRNALGMGRPGGTNPGRSVGVVSPELADQPMNLLGENASFMASQIVTSIIKAVAQNDAETPRKRGILGSKKTIDPPKADEKLREWAIKHYTELPPGVRSEIAAVFGINQAAVPEVGEAVGILNPKTMLGHFFPAVAKSGDDWVSLENDTDQKGGGGDTENSAWYYRMYGPAGKKLDQTAYGEAAKSGAYGEAPIVIRIVPIETLKTVSDCDRVASEQFELALAMLRKASHSFAYEKLGEDEAVGGAVKELLAEFAEADATDRSVGSLRKEVASWLAAGNEVLAKATGDINKKMAQRGVNTLAKLGDGLAAIEAKRDELSHDEQSSSSTSSSQKKRKAKKEAKEKVLTQVSSRSGKEEED